MNREIRKVEKQDVFDLKKVLDSSELFPSELLDDMIKDYFENKLSEDIWFTTIENNKPISIGYCAPERLTKGTYNLYAIAVTKELQGTGVGKAMIQYLENLLEKNGNRILIVETSGTSDFALTREFYVKCNFTEQARIPEFYDKDDDKVVFWKKIQKDF